MGRPKKKEKTAGPNDEICELCKHTFKHGRALSVHMFEEHSHGSLCTQGYNQSITFIIIFQSINQSMLHFISSLV